MAINKYKVRAKYGCWLCKEYEDNNNFCPYEECKYENDLKKYESYSDYEKDRKIADIEAILGLKKQKGKKQHGRWDSYREV